MTNTEAPSERLKKFPGLTNAVTSGELAAFVRAVVGDMGTARPDPAPAPSIPAAYVGHWNTKGAVNRIADRVPEVRGDRFHWRIGADGSLALVRDGTVTPDERGLRCAIERIDSGTWVRCSPRGGPVGEDDGPPATAPPLSRADDIGRRYAERAVRYSTDQGVVIAEPIHNTRIFVQDGVREDRLRNVLELLINAAVAEAVAAERQATDGLIYRLEATWGDGAEPVSWRDAVYRIRRALGARGTAQTPAEVAR